MAARHGNGTLVFLMLFIGLGTCGAWADTPLTFGDRVRAQEAVERVYYNHRIWPGENPGPKPPFERMISRAQIEAKIEDYLKKSAALEKFWQRPIQLEQLQAEMDRMAKQTKDSDTLRELFAALDNDPFLIAECLARPVLADRLIQNWYAYDTRFHRGTREKAEKVLKGQTPENFETYPKEIYRRTKYLLKDEDIGAKYSPGSKANSIEQVVPLDKDSFNETKARLALMDGIPSIKETNTSFIIEKIMRYDPNQLIVETLCFPKMAFGKWWMAQSLLPFVYINEKAESDMRFYLPPIVAEEDFSSTGYWVRSSLDEMPAPREDFTSIWTGTEMIIWGGTCGRDAVNVGARYNPSTDSWILTSTDAGCPIARSHHTAVWTGKEMIIWGGCFNHDDWGELSLNSGGRYDPSTDHWEIISQRDFCPSARTGHTAIWTGTEMIVWGGAPCGEAFSSGGRYAPETDIWRATSMGANCPSERSKHTAVWTGREMIVWGGIGHHGDVRSGSRYMSETDTWTATSTCVDCPSERSGHTAVWTGQEMIIWGGFNITGGRYNPTTDTWAATSTGAHCPTSRQEASAVWTGMEMIIWGGSGSTMYTEINTGGRYNPATDSWLPTSIGDNVPSRRSGHCAVWTGEEMIIWGATNDNTGARYHPDTDSWIPISVDASSPSGRSDHSAVWTGNEMIIWGGWDGNDTTNTGGCYIPATDAWTSVSMDTGSPSRRSSHTAVWTGREMIIWGGSWRDAQGEWHEDNSGGKYSPAEDAWSSTMVDAACPIPRCWHTAVWTGTEMIVWGGDNPHYALLNTGGRYDPSSDSWIPVSTANECPTGRHSHTAVWTGSEMIVWGGRTDYGWTCSGGKYDPVSDSWKPTPIGLNCPWGRVQHSAVWTGNEMIIWGGGYAPGDMLWEDLDSGGKYNPRTDAWIATSTEDGCPTPRMAHSAVWTGRSMIVWGGDDRNTGGVYMPEANLWLATDTGDGCPVGRSSHSAVWTGKEMIVWGGAGGLSSGGIYRPQSAHGRPVTPP
jgi:N-acetylneuraminic acid mutarotase